MEFFPSTTSLLAIHSATMTPEEPEYRVAARDEYPQCLNLWTTVFEEPASVFEPTHSAYEPEDGETVVATIGDEMVASVQIYYPTVSMGNGVTHRVGAIANVSTLPAHQGKGLSSNLLRLAIERMAIAGCDWSFLFTDINGFYRKLGWENVESIALNWAAAKSRELPQNVAPGMWMKEIYDHHCHRALRFARSEKGWQGRLHSSRWEDRILIGEPGSWYISAGKNDEEIWVQESYCVPGSEDRLAKALLELARSANKFQIKRGMTDPRFDAIVASLGDPTITKIEQGMVRPIGESVTVDQLQALFLSDDCAFATDDRF